jgi:CARDB
MRRISLDVIFTVAEYPLKSFPRIKCVIMMRGRLREAAIVLTIVVILLQLVITKAGLSAAPNYASVDVFTQKQPFSGKGQNAQSDAFGPQEVVFLYAQVWTDDSLVDNILVAFNVETPNDANFSVSARTNSSGIATVNFTIATPPINITENEVFGFWTVTGTILFAGQTFSDTLTFRVDYIVKLLTVRTIVDNKSSQSSFGIGGDVGFEITLRSIAMTLRNATISILVKDELDFTANFSLIEDFAAQPNGKLLFIYGKASLPKSAHIGIARVFISAFTAPVSEGGVAFCPAISADFQITTGEALAINLHDVAVVAVLPSSNPVELGSSLELTTLVRNEGTVRENFTVSTYFDGVLLGTAYVETLGPYEVQVFSYSINPAVVTLGNHSIRATVPPLADEADLTDNDFSDAVQVKTTQPTALHDVAIIAVTTSVAQVFVGDPVEIYVDIVNKGSSSETFDLSIYYNSSLIETRNVVGLPSLGEISLTFTWNTGFVEPGIYQIIASAPLLGDAQPSDNILGDGFVEIMIGPPQAHDVAVMNVVPYPRLVSAGQIVNINVTVKNKGNNTESFYVTTFYGNMVISKMLVTGLVPSAQLNLNFEWNTTGVPPGIYVISAVAETVEGETRTADNTFTDGTVTISSNILCLPPGWLFFLMVFIIAGIVGAILFILLLALDRIDRRRPRSVYTVLAHPHI